METGWSGVASSPVILPTPSPAAHTDSPALNHHSPSSLRAGSAGHTYHPAPSAAHRLSCSYPWPIPFPSLLGRSLARSQHQLHKSLPARIFPLKGHPCLPPRAPPPDLRGHFPDLGDKEKWVAGVLRLERGRSRVTDDSTSPSYVRTQMESSFYRWAVLPIEAE